MRKSISFFLFKQAIREILSLWKQFLAIIAIGAIAVTLFVGLQANADSLASRVHALYEAGNLADSCVTVNPAKGEQGDYEKIKEIVGEDGEVDRRFYSFAKINTHTAFCGVSPTITEISHPSEIIETSGEEKDFLYIDSLLSYSDILNDPSAMAIGDIATIEFDLSSFLEGVEIGGLTEALLSLFLQSGVQMKDTPLKTGSMVLKAPVTGIMNHPENVLRASYSVSLFLMSSSAFKKAFEESLSTYFRPTGVTILMYLISESPLGWKDSEDPYDFPRPNQFLVKAKEGKSIDSINAKIREYFDAKSDEDANLLLLQKKEDSSFASVMETDVTQARQLTFVFPFVFFIVAILVILTTMTQLILKERIQIGTLKAMGVGKRRIQLYYGLITTAVVGIGVLIGEIVGPILLPMILDNKYHILYNLPKLSYLFPVLPGILTAVVFLFSANLVTYSVCRKETNLLPVESMRPAVQNFAKKTRKSKEISKIRRHFAFTQAKRNLLVDPVKSIMVILGVMGCTALLCCGFGVDDTINKGISSDPAISYNADFTLTCTGDIGIDKMLSDAKNAVGEDFVGIEGYTNYDSTIRFGSKEMSSSLRIYSPSTTSEEEHKETALGFSWDIDSVLLTQKVADRIGAKVGDTISFTQKGSTYEAKISVIRDIFFSNGVYVYSTSSIFDDGEVKSFNCYYLDVKESADKAKAQEALRDKVKYVAAVDSSADNMEKIKGVLSSISSITIAIKIFAILLALVVLYNISLLNFKQRSRDIATMKVLGFNRFEIAGSLLFETLSLTFLGVLFGLLAGWPFLYLVLYINQVEVVSYPYFVAPLSYLFSFLLTFVVSALINIYFASRTNKVKMVESLKSVE